MGLILENLFDFEMIQKKDPGRRNRVLGEFSKLTKVIEDFINNKIEDYHESTLPDADPNDPMDQCYYETAPVFNYSDTAFDEWLNNYKDVIDSIAGIQRSHGEETGPIDHPELYHAAEDLIDVYQQMVFDMVDHCKSQAAIDECNAPNQKCMIQDGYFYFIWWT